MNQTKRKNKRGSKNNRKTGKTGKTGKTKKYYKIGGADGVVVLDSPDIEDNEPLECQDIHGKRLYVSKDVDGIEHQYNLIYISNFDGAWKVDEIDAQVFILKIDTRKISLLLNSLGEYIPIDGTLPTFNFTDDYDADYNEDDLMGKVLFEVTGEYIESIKPQLFEEKVRQCKICVIGANDGLLSDKNRWGTIDPHFIGFSSSDHGASSFLNPLEPFQMNWLADTDVFRRGFEMCKPHLPNNMFENIFIDRGTLHHLDERGVNAFAKLIEAIVETNISQKLCIYQEDWDQMKDKETIDSEIRSSGLFKVPKGDGSGSGFHTTQNGRDLSKSKVGNDIAKQVPIERLEELNDPTLAIGGRGIGVMIPAIYFYLRYSKIFERGRLINQYFDFTGETISFIEGDGFYVFNKKT